MSIKKSDILNQQAEITPKNLSGRRVFICCNDPFPFGTANSNYIRGLALAISLSGASVIVIGLKETQKGKYTLEKGEFEGVQYINIIQKKSKLPFRVYNHLFLGAKESNILKKFNIDKDDYIIVYSDFISISKAIFNKFPYVNNNGHQVYCIVEWFQEHQFTCGRFSLDYIFWKYHFDHLMPKYKKMIAISCKLNNHFTEKGLNVLTLPCTVDCLSKENNRPLQESNLSADYVRHFIYPGAATNKDSLEGIVKGLLLISSEERKKIRMHFTTLTKEKLMQASNCDLNELKLLEDVLIFHGKLEYDQLLQLYDDMDYLLLVRDDNIITQSNFPSKVPEMLMHYIVPVCSDVGDYTALYLRDGIDSLVFKGASAECCANAIRRAINLEKVTLTQMKKDARKLAEQKFDYRNWSARIAQFLIN